MTESNSFQTAFGRQGMCYAFGLVVLAPTLLWPHARCLSPDLDENREKSDAPTLASALQDPVDTVCDFRDFYNDNFPFRDAAIAMDSALRFDGLGVTWKNRVCMGEDGWMFLRENRQHAPVTLPSPDFPPQQMDEWLNILAQRQAAVAELGSEYWVIVAPNKATIYRDMRPDDLKAVTPDRRMTQLHDGMQTRGISFVDVSQPLIEARRESPDLYYRTDTHWNAIGAGYAAREVLVQLGETGVLPKSVGAQLLTDRNLSFEAVPFTGDLLRLLGAAGMRRERWITFASTEGYRWSKAICPEYYNKQLPKYMRTFATEHDEKTLPKAVVFRDSFTLDLQPFLSDAFTRSVYVWDYTMDLSIVESERPDVVLDIFVERRLASPTPAAFHPQ